VLDRARDRGEIDIVSEFSTHLPMMVIAEMLGLPEETREDLRHFSDRILDRGDADEVGNTTEATQRAMADMMALLMQIVDDKAEHLGDDIGSMLLTARVTDDEGNEVALTHEQVAYRLLELTIAGHETTAKLIANGVIALQWYPDQRAELVADPSLIPGAVEEMLRWDPPSHYQGRWVEREVTMHGTTIPANSRVVLITGAANHDERAFPDPEYFDIHRHIERHVGFGFGIHLCVGAALARLETRVAFEELLARYPNYEVRQPMVRAYSSNVRGLSNLPLALDPAA
jgi:cytochrome P450